MFDLCEINCYASHAVGSVGLGFVWWMSERGFCALFASELGWKCVVMFRASYVGVLYYWVSNSSCELGCDGEDGLTPCDLGWVDFLIIGCEGDERVIR